MVLTYKNFHENTKHIKHLIYLCIININKAILLEKEADGIYDSNLNDLSGLIESLVDLTKPAQRNQLLLRGLSHSGIMSLKNLHKK